LSIKIRNQNKNFFFFFFFFFFSSTHSLYLSHEGPVWQVAWLHPKFGNVLAACSYDRRVLIWKEDTPNQWHVVYQYAEHELSVNGLSWAPHTAGCRLACASSDGRLSVLSANAAGGWSADAFAAHQIGVNCVAWAPHDFAAGAEPTQRLASGGCDNLIKIWKFDAASSRWVCEHDLALHSDWVRDVAWAPRVGKERTLASCAQDGVVVIWTQRADSEAWQPRVLPKFNDVVWRVSWSLTGGILAVSGGDNKVTLWKEEADGAWALLSTLDEQQQTTTPAAN
jgi:protein transport protein SEC13